MKQLLCILLFFTVFACDNEKTGDNDSNLCWAASASNLIEYAGLGENVWATFKDHWHNDTGHTAAGLIWWLTGVNDNQGVDGFPQLKDLSYPGLGIRQTEVRIVKFDGIESIASGIADYGCVSLRIAAKSSGHWVTVWGVRGSSIFITNSDDGYHGIVEHTVDELGRMDGIYEIFGYVAMKEAK